MKGNFLEGRTFLNVTDLNEQALDWCNRQNSRYQKALNLIPIRTTGISENMDILAFDVHIKNFNDDAFSSKYKKAWNFIMEYDRKSEACSKHPVRL